MEKREVYDLINKIGSATFGTDWIYGNYDEIQWDIEDTLEARRQSSIDDEGIPEDEVDDICPIDSYETWYLINTENKSIRLFTECTNTFKWFKYILEEYPYYELWGYWAGEYMLTKYK